MKNVVDLFIAKDRTSVFWFTMACASILLSGMYVSKIISDVSTKPVYVVMDANNIYYFAPSVEFSDATPMHLAQTRLAMETIYTRKPNNLVFENRIRTLFYATGIKLVTDEFNKEAKKFVEEQRDQTIEITEVKVIKTDPSGGAVTEATGTITRHTLFKGQAKVERFSAKGRFGWRINKGMGVNGLPPTVCIDMRLADPAKLEAAE